MCGCAIAQTRKQQIHNNPIRNNPQQFYNNPRQVENQVEFEFMPVDRPLQLFAAAKICRQT